MTTEETFAFYYGIYTKVPLCESTNDYDNALYNNHWCYQTGMAFVHPHPTRHFTFEEFKQYLSNNPETQLLTFLDKFSTTPHQNQYRTNEALYIEIGKTPFSFLTPVKGDRFNMVQHDVFPTERGVRIISEFKNPSLKKQYIRLSDDKYSVMNAEEYGKVTQTIKEI